jgi:hypothetical protein
VHLVSTEIHAVRTVSALSSSSGQDPLRGSRKEQSGGGRELGRERRGAWEGGKERRERRRGGEGRQWRGLI